MILPTLPVPAIPAEPVPATQVAVAAAFIPVRNVKTFLPMVILAGAVLIKKVLSVTENQILRAITAHLQAILFV